jgi:hypothetical protein
MDDSKRASKRRSRYETGTEAQMARESADLFREFFPHIFNANWFGVVARCKSNA